MQFRASLFVKIYATLLAAIIVLVLLLGGAWRYVLDRPDPSDRFPRRIAEAFLPPPDAPLFETRRAIGRIAEALDADIVLLGPDGERIARVGDPDDDSRGRRAFDTERRVWRVRLGDGRVLIARFEAPLRPPPMRMLITLILAALAVAIVALPAVWLLTRRLKRLRQSVEAFGEGQLGARATISGTDEVAVLAKSFNASAERIEQLIGAHRSLLANASHELRSPLTRLRLAIDLQGEQPTEARRSEIIRNLEEMDQLIEEILLASRLDRPEIALLRERTSLADLLADEAARHGVEMQQPLAPTFVSGDPVLLRRLIRNLIENALKHGAPPVSVALRAAGVWRT